MPTSTEQVFTAFQERKFDVITALIEGEPALINAVNSENGNSLLQSLLGLLKATDPSDTLIKRIVTDKGFDFGYVNPKSQLTNLDRMISSTRLDVFRQVIKNPSVIFNNAKLTYESAQEQLRLLLKVLQKELDTDPESAVSARFKIKVQHAREITSLLRDATILFAISIDEPELLDRLNIAGANPTSRLGSLGNEKLPIDLLTSKTPKIEAWFQRSLEQSVASTAKNPNSFLNKAKQVEELQAQLSTLKIEHAVEKIEAKKQLIEDELVILDQVKAAIM